MMDQRLFRLLELYKINSKHSNYQELTKSLSELLGVSSLEVRGRQESERLKAIAKHVEFDGKTVLDIGGNTGFFSFSALEYGARLVTYFEGNEAHANFVQLAASILGVEDRLRVNSEYFNFLNANLSSKSDICMCLNVVHHFGDDFGDRDQSRDMAREGMVTNINAMANFAKTLIFQMGYNWKGDVTEPLFRGGLKREMIDFVTTGTTDHWTIDAILVAEPDAQGYVYKLANSTNLDRFDQLGEFLNRPLFIMRSQLFR